MSRLYQEMEDWIYESDNGIEYSILEGIGNGKNRSYTSDIAFILLDGYCEDNIPTTFVGMRYGYGFIDKDDDFGDSIAKLVEEFERTHPSIVKELGNPRPFAENKELLQSFFSLTKAEFLSTFDDIRERDYDETARIVAERVASIRTWN